MTDTSASTSNVKWILPKGKQWIGVIVTTAFIFASIYIIAKYGKKNGFWIGFGAALLLMSYLIINSDGSFDFNLGFFGLSTGPDVKNK